MLSLIGPGWGGRHTGNQGFFNQNPQTPQNQRWQLSIQHEFPGGWLLDTAYLGNRGTRLEITRDINALPAQYWRTSPVRDQATINFLTAAVPNPYAGQLLVTGGLINPTVARWQTFRPYPYYSDLTTSTNQGYTWYHSLQVNASKRFSKGYTAQFSYTWSKFMEAIGYLNPFDPSGGSDLRGRSTSSFCRERNLGTAVRRRTALGKHHPASAFADCRRLADQRHLHLPVRLPH